MFIEEVKSWDLLVHSTVGTAALSVLNLTIASFCEVLEVTLLLQKLENILIDTLLKKIQGGKSS